MHCGMLFGLTTRNAEQDIQSPKFFAMIVPARAVFAEQIFERRAAEPSSDGVARRHQHVPALRPEQRPDQAPDRHGKAVLFTVGDPLRQIAAGKPLQKRISFRGLAASTGSAAGRHIRPPHGL